MIFNHTTNLLIAKFLASIFFSDIPFLVLFLGYLYYEEALCKGSIWGQHFENHPLFLLFVRTS